MSTTKGMKASDTMLPITSNKLSSIVGVGLLLVLSLLGFSLLGRILGRFLGLFLPRSHTPILRFPGWTGSAGRGSTEPAHHASSQLPADELASLAHLPKTAQLPKLRQNVVRRLDSHHLVMAVQLLLLTARAEVVVGTGKTLEARPDHRALAPVAGDPGMHPLLHILLPLLAPALHLPLDVHLDLDLVNRATGHLIDRQLQVLVGLDADTVAIVVHPADQHFLTLQVGNRLTSFCLRLARLGTASSF